MNQDTDFDRQALTAGHREPFAQLMTWPHRADLLRVVVKTDGK